MRASGTPLFGVRRVTYARGEGPRAHTHLYRVYYAKGACIITSSPSPASSPAPFTLRLKAASLRFRPTLGLLSPTPAPSALSTFRFSQSRAFIFVSLVSIKATGSDALRRRERRGLVDGALRSSTLTDRYLYLARGAPELAAVHSLHSSPFCQ